MLTFDDCLEEVEAERAFWREQGQRFDLVVASGFFNPLHVGHLAYLREAGRLGDALLVLVNGDDAARRKHGHSFMPEADRCEIVAELGCVTWVALWPGPTVEDAIRLARPAAFANGGDRSDWERLCPAEVEACREVGCRVVTGVGGADKPRSSSRMVRDAALAMGLPAGA